MEFSIMHWPSLFTPHLLRYFLTSFALSFGWFFWISPFHTLLNTVWARYRDARTSFSSTLCFFESSLPFLIASSVRSHGGDLFLMVCLYINCLAFSTRLIDYY